jgi:hypothetical protein
MCTASSAYTGVPGQQQAPLDVRTSEGQAERPAHHPDILTMAPQGPQRITSQVYPSKYSAGRTKCRQDKAQTRIYSTGRMQHRQDTA